MIRNIFFCFWLLILSTEAFAIHPYKDYVAVPSQVGMSYDSLNIPTADHFRLTGWYCKPAKDSSDLLIILAGTDAGNMSYDLQVEQFIVQNFHVPVLLFDYRGFGSSQMFAYDANAIGHPEYLIDLDAVVLYAQKKYPGKKIVVYGRSLGAALALVEGAMRTGIAGVVAESPYSSQVLLAKHYKDENTSDKVKPIESDSLEPLKNIRNFRAANLLILHGENEKHIQSKELKALIEHAPISNKKFIDFPGCDHLELPSKAPQQFGDAMAAFLTQCE
jgi:alpha-beta hydrolase superfamily lysophospholipase